MQRVIANSVLVDSIKGGVRCLPKGVIDISVRRSNKSKKSTEPFQDVLFPDEKV
jgi:hypothetical protein